jgi:predicted dehydrogenase
MRLLYNALIIGAGNIGAFFDTPDSENILTHAHAYWKHKGFNLLGFVDIDQTKSRKAASIWGGNGYSSIEDAFKLEMIDVVSVAVPDEYHFEVLKKLSRFPVKLVFTEKPLARTLNEAREIFDLYSGKNIPVAVNYSRRFVPEIQKIKNNIEKGQYGPYMAGTGYYGKGLVHNGSHLIDLLRFFKREATGSVPISSIVDFYPDDKSISAVLSFKDKTHFTLLNADCRSYTLFEIDLLFEKGRIRILDSGFRIEEYKIRQNTLFKGYRNLFKTKETDTSLGNSVYFAIDNIHNHLTKGAHLACSLEDGYKTLKTCLKIKNQSDGQ